MKKGKLGAWLRVLFFAILLGLVIWLLGGCVTTTPITKTETKTEKTDINKPKPIIWKQTYYKGLSLKDSVLFYNSTEIRLEGNFFNQSFFVRNGVVNVIDSTSSVSKIVQQETPGGLIDLKRDRNGIINIMYVSFSQNETSYNFSFYRTEDGSFVLNGKAEILFQGKKYPVIASTIGGNCVLLFYLNREEIKNEVKETAPGWSSGQSY